MLADTESEKTKWVVALSELHRILKRNNLPNTTAMRARTILEGAAGGVRGALAACSIDPDRLVLGGEDGLSCVDLERGEITRCTAPDSKRIHLIEYLPEEQLMVVLSGKHRQVRLVPIRAVECPDVEWIKVPDTKGCVTLATGAGCSQPSLYYLVVALKRQVRLMLRFDRKNRIGSYCVIFFRTLHILLFMRLLERVLDTRGSEI